MNNLNNHNNNNLNNDNNNEHYKQPMKLCGCTNLFPKTINPPSLFQFHYLLKPLLSLFLLFSLLFFLSFFSSSSPSSAVSSSYFFSLHPSSPAPTTTCHHLNTSTSTTPTQPHHLLFSLSGSSPTFLSRRHYSLLWWVPNSTRGSIFLDTSLANPLPPSSTGPTVRVSPPGRPGERPSDRMARVLKESFELKEKDVRWFVVGDDDSVFFVDNLVKVLQKFDHREMYYVGGSSESVEQDLMHNYETAFGGGGFAVSYALACEMVRILEGCVERYRGFYGSDEKVSACVSEFGVPLTRHPGFHQLDIRGDPYGLLAAHPVAPLVSLHHLDYVKPLFPSETQEDSLRRLMQAYHVDPGLTVQQSICYDHRRKWSLSISWGYTAQLYPSLISSRVLSMPLQTFHTWRSHSNGPFIFNTRPVDSDPCERPVIFFLDKVMNVSEDKSLSIYKRAAAAGIEEKCKKSDYKYAMSVEKMTVTAWKTNPEKWLKAPRRQCCEIESSWTLKANMRIEIRSCKPGESITI